MVATPKLLRSTVPIMNLSDNINTKYIVTEGP